MHSAWQVVQSWRTPGHTSSVSTQEAHPPVSLRLWPPLVMAEKPPSPGHALGQPTHGHPERGCPVLTAQEQRGVLPGGETETTSLGGKPQMHVRRELFCEGPA